jgi:hypothetical protein
MPKTFLPIGILQEVATSARKLPFHPIQRAQTARSTPPQNAGSSRRKTSFHEIPTSFRQLAIRRGGDGSMIAWQGRLGHERAGFRLGSLGEADGWAFAHAQLEEPASDCVWRARSLSNCHALPDSMAWRATATPSRSDSAAPATQSAAAALASTMLLGGPSLPSRI